MGDALMATGEARALSVREGGRQVCILGLNGQPHWSPVYEFNPRLMRSRSLETLTLVNGPNARPYIAGKTKFKWTWRLYQPIPGELHFSGAETAIGAQHARSDGLIIEPNVKHNTHANKAWLWERWQALVSAFPSGTFTQVGPVDARWLAGVRRVVTSDFRSACAVLNFSGGYVGTEGGLHHAAAALNKPAVVLWSEFISPEITGYPQHINLRRAGEPCGSRTPCQTCAASMAAISVDEVITAVGALL